MKNHQELTELNFQAVMFFLGKTTEQAKELIYQKGFPTCVAAGEKVKITPSQMAPLKELEVKITSVYPEFDGKGKIEITVEAYNKGVSMAQLKKWSENKGYIKSLKFTGKESILNEILNEEQYKKLQVLWAFAAVYPVAHYTKRQAIFIRTTPGLEEALKCKGIVNVSEKVDRVLNPVEELN